MMKCFMIKISSLVLSILIVSSCIYAKNEKPKLLSRDVESAFSVEQNKIEVTSGDIDVCLSDREFVVNAFQSKHVDISSYAYDVLVEKINTSYVNQFSDDPLAVNRYSITFHGDIEDENYKELVEDIKVKGYLTGNVSSMKAPVTCHYYLNDNEIVILSYYGFPDYYGNFDPESVINLLKNQLIK